MTAAVHDEARPAAGIVERLLLVAAREIQLLGAVTPCNAPGERTRLVEALRTDAPATPRWTYARWEKDDLRRALEAAEQALSHRGASPLDRLHLDRVRELSVEAALCAAAGTAELARLAPLRFAPVDPAFAAAGAACCEAWLAEPPPAVGAETIASDAEDPRSLLSLLRAAVGQRRLPFTVVVQPSLASLAATGDGVLLVAPGRPVTQDDAARTVLHEIEGHALPRTRAAASALALMKAGTARGIDDQEGYALMLEERAGLLGPRRRRQLAARHRAFEAMTAAASFEDVARALVRDHGLEPMQAVLTAERVFRGGTGRGPGLGRERVYLEALARVRAHVAVHPEDEEVLASGQVAVDAAPALRDLTSESTRTATWPYRRTP
ncbi:MAG TPA: tyrosine/phenylalanine carboxypeptidase domain-containing protein [Polyangiaceae bacterium]|jgi:hypothetical protein